MPAPFSTTEEKDKPLFSTKKPAYRKLRGYAFDPTLSIQLDTMDVNIITYKVEWEELEEYPGQKRRYLPMGEYLEIIDVDPASGVFYPPVDLNDPYVLAQDGLDPSIASPQFHQQMVYAVAMTTIKNFEQALGRRIQWSDHIYHPKDNNSNFILNSDGKRNISSSFVRRLRIYPHALRQANAYYNPLKKSLLFGYFPAAPANAQLHLPGGTVFTCLSHDIIAHETTHAILDGLQRLYIEPTHPDTRAFHEAFSDIVALFQHFTFTSVLKQQIARTRGNLSAQNLLGQLAQQFGRARGGYGGLRDAIGYTNDQNEWVLHKPDPRDYQTKMKFHDRGAILVAAVFDAFLSIYKKHIQSNLRLATGGTGTLPDGDLHPDLVDHLADIAASTARRVLRICVRALDYCPPVDINFGDYLRALITADRDMVPEDEEGYRVAFVEAFQKRGIFPKGLKSMSVEALCYTEENPAVINPKVRELIVIFLKKFKEAIGYETNRERIYEHTREFIGGSPSIEGLHGKFAIKFLEDADSRQRFGELTGLVFPDTSDKCEEIGFEFSNDYGTAKYQISNLWLANRVTPNGNIVNHVIVNILQRRGVTAKISNDLFSVNGHFVPHQKPEDINSFIFRGGSTLIFDLDTACLKYAIKKDINDLERMEQQYRIATNRYPGAESFTYFNEVMLSALAGPFAFMHSFPHQH